MIIILPLIIVIGLAWWLNPGKNPSSPRKIAILATVIPVLMLAIVSTVFQLLHNAAGTIEVSDISNICFIAGCGLIGISAIAAVGLALLQKKDIARGLGLGVCLSVAISIVEFGVLEWLGGV